MDLPTLSEPYSLLLIETVRLKSGKISAAGFLLSYSSVLNQVVIWSNYQAANLSGINGSRKVFLYNIWSIFNIIILS